MINKKRAFWNKLLLTSAMASALCVTYVAPINASNSRILVEVSQQNNRRVTGKVTSTTGEPLIGVSIIIKGTTTGTTTDLDGNFVLNNVTQGATLKCSYVGYETQEVKVVFGKSLDIQLKDDAQMLDEVVAIGYGTVKKRDITGAVASVGNNELTTVPVSSPVEAMQGKLAGVRVTMPEGSPDAEIVIRVRGGGSITRDNSPLYIVDGFPVNSINDIPTSEIESIDVLKDASSTAIYGSRGANGIVLVTTRSGKAGKVTVNYNAYIGFKNAISKTDVLDMPDYLKWSFEKFAMDNQLPKYTSVLGSWADISNRAKELSTTDWQEEVYGRTGHVFSQNINISGGSEKLRFTLGYSHNDEKAILYSSKYKRDNFSFKMNYEPNKKVKIDFSARYSRTKVYGDGQSSSTGESSATPSGSFSRINSSITQTPIVLGNGTDGGIILDPTTNNEGLESPIIELDENYKKRDRENLNLNGSFTWNIIKNLSFRTEVGMDVYRNTLDYFCGPSTYESKNNTVYAENRNLPLLDESTVDRRAYRNANTLNYDFKEMLGDNHNLDLMVGQEIFITTENKITARIEGFPDFYNYDMAMKFTAQGQASRYNKYFYADDKMISFFGRANYNYMGRYLLTASFRADGSSRFAKGNRWGYFPSVAAAWRISEENFMAGTQDWLSNLKLRLSYGLSGNNNIPLGQTLREFSITSNSWMHVYDGSFLSQGTRMTNPDLKWESTHSLNAGIDFGFFNGRLNGSIEVYKNNVKNLLMEMTTNGSGYNTQFQNVGETQNTGVELTLNYTILNTKKYGLDFSFTIGHNKNKVKSLGAGRQYYDVDTRWCSNEIGSDYRVEVGKPVGQIIGFVTDGRYEVDDFSSYNASSDEWILKEGVTKNSLGYGKIRPGSLKLKDMTNDGNVTNDDKVVIGDANAWATGGFSLGGRVGNFDLNANFSYSLGNDIYNADKIEQTSTRSGNWRNLNASFSEGNRWTNIDEQGNLTNDPSKLAALNANTTLWSPNITHAVLHSWAIEDGSFLRLNNITLGYTLPKNVLSKIYIQNLRLYATASNLFCITSYSGADPEVDCKRNMAVCPGLDYSAYPKSRQFIFGVNLTF